MPSDSATAAHQLAAAGRAEDAVAALKSAGEGGDAVALAELAAWYLRGDIIPRDLPGARAALRRAVKIGHVDAALMEVALTANGTGAAPDWSGAVALLARAAKQDPIAAQHMALLSAMKLHLNGAPRTLPEADLIADSPRIVRFRGFITPQEAAHIAGAVSATLEPARVFDPASGRMIPHAVRDSDNAAIGPTQESLVIQAINRRIAAATGTDPEQGEPLTVLRYAPGQQYKLHMDALPDGRNQRMLTAILYLNDGFRGGETAFPLLNINIAPRAGDLLVFQNVREDGSPHTDSRHAGLPVTAGVKWIATRWIRTNPISPWTMGAEG